MAAERSRSRAGWCRSIEAMMETIEKETPEASSTVPSGPLVIHYPEGQKAQEVAFVAGKIEGEVVHYDRQGQVAARLTFRQGVLEGPMTVFAHGKRLAAMTYHEGELEGKATVYDAAGGTQMISTYRRGSPDGVQQLFYPNGKMQRVTPYRDGKIEGEVIDYHEDESVRQRTLWRAGVPVPSAVEPAASSDSEASAMIGPEAARKRSWIDIL